MFTINDSSRLTYRLMEQSDAQDLWLLDQDPEVMQFINGGKANSRSTIDSVFIPRMLSYMNPEKGWGIWKVSEKNSQEYLGWVLVRPMDFFSDAPKYEDIELGWRFFKNAWGKGYATEAASTIKDALTEQEDIGYFSALALKDNVGSINIMKKIGMNFIKEYLHQDPIGDFQAVHYQMAAK